ncbi:pilus assembly protein TadB [Lachnospiraceae bacterium]|nr:pilus assembly protein TadB [Lachnospiraceae bacterium]
MFAKKQKKEKEPRYILSPLGTELNNYRVYYMSIWEKLLTFFAALVIGGFCGLVFYGNQFLDSTGYPTGATKIGNMVIFVSIGLLAGFYSLPTRAESLKKKRQQELALQFRSLLEALAVSLSSGMNMSDSLQAAYKDLRMEYTDKADIVGEVEEMILGIQNNIEIEEMILSLGERSENADIKNFATVFSVSYRAGGNIKDIVRRTGNIISEKIEINGEIETALSSNKVQFKAMMVIPVVMMLMLRGMSSDFAASFSTLPGILATTVAIILFGIAYVIGQKIMDIKG